MQREGVRGGGRSGDESGDEGAEGEGQSDDARREGEGSGRVQRARARNRRRGEAGGDGGEGSSASGGVPPERDAAREPGEARSERAFTDEHDFEGRFLGAICNAVADMAAEGGRDRARGLSAGGGGMDHVVVARLCASALVHAECDAPIWKKSGGDMDGRVGGGGSGDGGESGGGDLRGSAGAARIDSLRRSAFRTTPAELFAQRNAFLDEADGLTNRLLLQSRRRIRPNTAEESGGALADQKGAEEAVEGEEQQGPRYEKSSAEGVQRRRKHYEEAARREDLWEQIDYLYSMLAHAIESMSPEDCQEWLRMSAEVDFRSDDGNDDGDGEYNRYNYCNDVGSASAGEKTAMEDLDAGSVQRQRGERRRRKKKKKKGKKKKGEKKKKKKKKQAKWSEETRKYETRRDARHPLHSLLQQLVSVASCSDDEDERGAARSVLEALFENGIALDVDETLCDLLCSETLCLAIHADEDSVAGSAGRRPGSGVGSDRSMVIVAELLNLLLKIVATFASPLTPPHRKLLRRVVLPLHASAGLPCFLNEIIPIVLHLLQKAEHGRPGVILDYLRRMERAWPRCSPRSERAFLSEMLDVLTHIHWSIGAMSATGGRSSARIDLMAQRHGDDGLDPRMGGGGLRALEMLEAAAEEVFVGIARCLQSPHFEVAMHATSAFTECDAVRLILFGGGSPPDSCGTVGATNRCATRCLEAVMPSLLDGAEYWHAGVKSRCREVVRALKRGSQRGWLDHGLIEGMLRSHYGEGEGGMWLEEDEENRFERQDVYDSYSSGDEFHGKEGGLSPSGIRIGQVLDENAEDRVEDDDDDMGEVNESKYVSPGAEEQGLERRRKETMATAANKTNAPEKVSSAEEVVGVGESHRHSDEWPRDTGDTEDTDYTEDSDYYDTRSNRSSRSVRSRKSSRSSASTPPPVTPPRVEREGSNAGSGLLAAAAKAAARDTKSQHHGIRGRRGGENVDTCNPRRFAQQEGDRKSSGREDWAVASATREKSLFDVTPPLSPSFVDARKLDALYSPSPTRGYGGSRRRGRRGVAMGRRHSRRRARDMPYEGRGRGSALRRAVLNQRQSLRGEESGSMMFAGIGGSGNENVGRRSVVVRGGPSSPKFVVHDGRKKRLAWGGAAAQGRENNGSRRRHHRRAPPVISSDSSKNSSSGEDSDNGVGGGVVGRPAGGGSTAVVERGRRK